MLARRFPKHWAETKQHQGTDGPPIQIQAVPQQPITNEFAQQILDAMDEINQATRKPELETPSPNGTNE